MSAPEPVAVSWSGGKDSALALHAIRADPSLRVEALVTTITDGYDRISMHGVRRSLLDVQVAALGVSLVEARIPIDASNASYEAAMTSALSGLQARGISRVVFGDLFLADVREYRERLLAGVGMRGLYPLWLRDTRELAEQFIESGFRAILACVDPRQVPAALCGREFDHALLSDLPKDADPCGERGEFHTFVYDGPIFETPIAVERGEVVKRGGFWFQDLGATEGGNSGGRG
ncbi:MAG: ATP-binding protein [Gemmatimonadaceae bacterium]